MSSEPLHLALVGATGAAGRALLELLEQRDFPVKSLRLLASERSAGTDLAFRGDPLAVEPVTEAAFEDRDLAFFFAGPAVSREWGARAAASGCVVVDGSSAFRMEEDIPLVVPEVNPGEIARWEERRIVASPGPSTVQLALALKPIQDAAGLERVVVSTYQSVSGAGHAAVEQLEREAQALMNGLEPPEPGRIPQRVAFNLVPHIGAAGADGFSEEEAELARETRKVLGLPALRLSATAVRVPVFYGYGQSVNVATRRKLVAGEARELLRRAPGVKLLDSPAEGIYPMPMLAVNDDAVLVGRVRDDPSQESGLELFVVADNLRRGAAANAVQIGEIVAEKYL